LGSLTLARGSPPRDADVLILAIGDVGSQLAPHGRDTPRFCPTVYRRIRQMSSWGTTFTVLFS